jgi:stringent starvation protein B
MYQWVVDNGMTPHLLVDANTEDCLVPLSLVNDGKIVLNVAPMAVNGLVLGDEEISFSARFDGKPDALSFRVGSVLAIYARENGQGMMFSDADDASLVDTDNEPDPNPDPDPVKPRPKLKVVK